MTVELLILLCQCSSAARNLYGQISTGFVPNAKNQNNAGSKVDVSHNPFQLCQTKI
jgi:hypothetical protein